MKRILGILLAAAVLLCFVRGIADVENQHRAEGKRQLGQALRRTALACYAAEGAYPPSVEYMQQHYGLRYDEEDYTVHYSIFASNLMPDITVLEK